MKKLIIFSTILFAINISALAYRYDFNLIPSELKHRADAIVRTEQMTYEIIDIGKVNVKYKFAITLLNDDASYYRFARIQYNPFIKIKNIKGSVYDEKGRLIKIIKKTEILDMSSVNGAEFYSDDRQKVIFFPKMKYPYTIEYEYESIISSLINYPEWSFQENPNVSVEKSGIQYVFPKNLQVKFKEINLKTRIDSVSLKNKIILTWQEENIPTVKSNPYGIPFSYRAPTLLSAPYEFNYGGYQGSLASWEKFGEWSKKMIEGRDQLPQEETERIKNIVKDLKSERDKIKAVYEYMQSRTRYVLISLGIGGFQPFEASYVSEKGFGDCKALTNYTMSLLKAVGIKSYYTLIKSGSNENINPTFVSNQFDHIILCVPQNKDTVWLECTSQSLPFNYLSDFTSDRYALLTTEDGGKLVKTPSFKKEDNYTILTGTVSIDHLGSITTAKFAKEYSGIHYGRSQNLFTQESEDEIKRYLNRTINIPTFSVTKVLFTETKSENPKSKLEYNLEIRDFSTRNTNKLFFTPCIDKFEFLLNEPFSIQISESNLYQDSIIYKIPIGYTIDFIPEVKSIESSFGKYNYTLVSENDKIIFTRNLELIKGKYPVEKFEEFYQFINAIATKDREKVVLKKL